MERQTRVASFIRRICSDVVSLAQLVEQLTLNQWVESSSLSGDTNEGCLI